MTEKCVTLAWEALHGNESILDGLTFCHNVRLVSIQLLVSGGKAEAETAGDRGAT